MIKSLHPYFQLMRLTQPTGIWLLLLPCWWGVALASPHLPSPYFLAMFALGAIVMRGAGCVVNDLWDREIDAKVERTRGRPLASGAITVPQALMFLLLLLVLGFLIALALPPIVFGFAVASLPLVLVYPLMKRITWWPQAFLGLTFNWGALMGYAAVKGTLDAKAVLLYAAGVFWTLGYDTIYAHQDRVDDEAAGIKSSARRLGNKSRRFIALFYTITVLLLAATGTIASLAPLFYAALAVAAMHFAWQCRKLDIDSPAACLRLFKSNMVAGVLIFLSLLLGRIGTA